MDTELEERAQKLHEESIVFDAQAKDPDVFSQVILKRMNEQFDASVSFPEVAAELERLCWIDPDRESHDLYKEAWKRTGVDALCVTVGVLLGGDGIFGIYKHSEVPEMWSFACAIKHIHHYTIKFEDTYRDVIQKATMVGNIFEARKKNKHAILFKFQNSLHIARAG